MTHLTETQLTDIVAEGVPSPTCQAHLATCPACRRRVDHELAAFSASIADFNYASIAWSAAQPRRAFLPPAPRPFYIRFAPAALACGMAAMAVAVAPIWHAQPAPVTAPDNSADIAADNLLLQQVNVALAANDPSPLDEYQLQEPTSPAANAANAVQRAQ